MKDRVYKLIELTDTSTTSIEDAVDRAVRRAHKTIKNVSWWKQPLPNKIVGNSFAA